jgi:hypothetical protein
MPDDRDKTYDVGFGKPPSHGQFRKGVSGNPRGRPKGKRNLATVLERTLQEKVVINENGDRKTVTKLEAALKQMVNKAAGGDLAAMRQLSALASLTEAETVATETKSTLTESDQKIRNRLLEKLQQSKKETNENDNKP